jgi:hypothetical protein
MNFRPVIFLARWTGLAAVVMTAMPGAAQQAAQQTIQFTRPVDQDLSSKANAFMPAPNHRNSAAAFNAPSSLFGGKDGAVNFDVLPGSPNQNPVSAASAAQWRKFLDGKKNWTLMTPEENLGIQTSEEILGITDPKDDPKLSPEERFLQRLDRRAAAGATNGFHHPDASYWRDNATTDQFHSSDASSRFAQMLGGSLPGANKNGNPLFNLNSGSPSDVNQKPDSTWASPFGMPQPLAKPTPEALADMNRFRALMEPSAPEKSPEPSRFSLPPVAAPDRNLQAMPAFNPAGRSFTALESGIGKPTGLTPLPGLTGPHPVPTKKTASLVQLPPWLSDSPQSFAPVQRQF